LPATLSQHRLYPTNNLLPKSGIVIWVAYENPYMPTIQEYTNDPGYFIRARPSSVESPITYQIEPEGYAIIDSYGLSHEDQISWSVIQSLKSLGLLYTNKSGVIGSDDFEPDPDQLKETELDEKAALRLAKVISENIDISSEKLREILSILNIDPSLIDDNNSILTTRRDFPTPQSNLNMPNFPVHDEIDVLNGETIYKTNDWWKAAILSDGYQGTEILIYLWHKDGSSWKRSQKYKVKSQDEWEKEKEIVDRLISGSN
jgi:hypothetical protein